MMSEIQVQEAPLLLLRMVPETAQYIAEMYEMPASEAVGTEDVWYDLYQLLDEAFTRPIVQPELRKEAPDAELMGRCFEFVEILTRASSQYFTGAVYFQVLDALLEEEDLLERAIPFMREKTRKDTVQMLIGYENPVPEELLR
ncbi:hypothetical protein [Streptomyces halobius]|uniref:Uncharacterized protein n=1 Tax=Streptomyces halobius TaxID=2879846 RepID=A0ABY4ML77_9ACTN|nr:hypothetical protein [Streptomyces halobius]UQA97081.1 hypothetical protein K9S39_39080 [Streptomyces halobius]